MNQICFQGLSPTIHSIATLLSMLYEIALTPFQTQEQGWVFAKEYGLLTYDDCRSLHIKAKHINFDLYILDIGNYELHKTIFASSPICSEEQQRLIFFDDFHVPAYRAFIERLCAKEDSKVLSLRKVTRRRLRHTAFVISSSKL